MIRRFSNGAVQTPYFEDEMEIYTEERYTKKKKKKKKKRCSWVQ